MNERNPLLGRLRLVATFLLLGLLVAAARPRILDLVVGAVLVVAGESLRLWSAGHLRKTVELITSGPYRHTRNPLYLGRLLIFSGLCVAARLPGLANLGLLVAGWIAFFAYYLPRKERVEPARLLAVHGESYAAYRRAVPALWPRPTPWSGGSTASWSWRRTLANREPWMVLGLLLVLALLVAFSNGAPRI